MKDLYLELIKYYRYVVGGPIPNEEDFLKALKMTVTQDELRLFFLLPLHESMLETELADKAEKIGIDKALFDEYSNRLVKEGVVLRYTLPEGRALERSNVVFMTEQQVRKPGDSYIKQKFAEFFDKCIDPRDTDPESKEPDFKAMAAGMTPWYRAIPVEATVTKTPVIGKHTLNIPVADPRTVMPIDIVSEMVKAQPLIAIADCYCRATEKVMGKDCGHLMETCFCFNDLAESLIDCGTARKIEVDEALDILRKCEEQGLIHFIDNAEGELRGLCNCCACSCIMIKTFQRSGPTSSGTPSRFIISLNNDKCISCGLCVKTCQMAALSLKDSMLQLYKDKCFGCGQCVSRCPEGAIQLVPRDSYAKIYKTKLELNTKINSELKKDPDVL